MRLLFCLLLFSLGFTQDVSSAENYIVIAVGDIVCKPGSTPKALTCQDAATAALTQNLSPDAVLALGDLQYENGEYEHFLDAYDKTWGQFKAITYPSPGNHEYGNGSAAEGYFRYFGNRAGELGKGYYSFELGNWHLISLNSNCDDVDCEASSEQVDWLERDLAEHTDKCVLAFWHHPPISSGRYSGESRITPFLETLYAADAELILTAHDHRYERFKRLDPLGKPNSKGLRQFVVGTGGKSLYKERSEILESEKTVLETFGVLRLELLPTSYRWAFVDLSGKVHDSGEEDCH